MSIVWVNTGELEALANGLSNDGDWSIKLYTNNHTPDPTDTPAAYTEATFNGYAAGDLARNGAMYTDATGKATQDYDPITYDFTDSSGSADVYGWFAVNSSAVLIMAELFGTMKTFDPSHPSLELQITLQAYSAF